MSYFILCAFLFTHVFAAETLDQIDVNAAKSVERYTFSQTETLEKEELEQVPMPLVSQVLERVPGLVTSQNGGPGSRTTFFIRGTEAKHISFTLDGLKLNDSSNVDRQFDAAFLTLTSVDEIQVHKGPQAILYGSDAMGGHIEMTTRKGSKNPEKKVTLSGGSFGTLGLAYRQDWTKGTVSLIRQRSDGISRFNKKRSDATERDGSETTQLTSSSTHEFMDKLRTDLLGSFIEGKNELDVMSDSSKDKSRSHQYLLQQKSTYQISKSSAVSLRNGLNRNDRQIEDAFSEQNYSGNLIQNELLWENSWGEHKLISGVASEVEQYHLTDRRSFTLSSGFLQGILREGDYSFQGGLRADHHSRYQNFMTGSAGIEMSKVSGIWAFQYSRGYKAPSLYQLYGPPMIGNRDLNPESNQSYEASWKKKFSSLELENVFFQNRLSSLIIYGGSGYRNQGRFIAEGFEPSLKWKGESGEVRGSYTHQIFRKTEETVLRRPYNMAQLSGTLYVNDQDEIFAKGRWFDSRIDKDFSWTKEVKLSSFETFDLGGTHRWKNQSVTLQIQNIFNRDYEEVYGFSVLPRSLFGSYSLTF